MSLFLFIYPIRVLFTLVRMFIPSLKYLKTKTHCDHITGLGQVVLPFLVCLKDGPAFKLKVAVIPEK